MNAFFGTGMGLGLWAVGIPNAPLWGVLAFVLRFVPFIGAWLFLCFPVAIAVLTSEGWSAVLLVLAVFAVVDVTATYVLEPWLYGTSAGITPLALLLSSATWTVLWGPVGLILAPAITACLVIIGRHVPALAFLDVLLGAGEALPAPTRFYQRLLADDVAGARAMAEAQAAKDGVLAALGDLAVPALAAAGRDRREQRLSDREVARLAAAIAGSVRTLSPAGATAGDPARPIMLVPVAGPLDAAAAAIVGAALRSSGRTVAPGGAAVDAAAANPPALALLCAAGPTGRRVARAVAAARRAGAPVALVTLANKGAAGEGTDTLPPGLGRHFAGLTAMITALGGVTSSPQPGESPGVETAGETVQPAMTETVP